MNHKTLLQSRAALALLALAAPCVQAQPLDLQDRRTQLYGYYLVGYAVVAVADTFSQTWEDPATAFDFATADSGSINDEYRGRPVAGLGSYELAQAYDFGPQRIEVAGHSHNTLAAAASYVSAGARGTSTLWLDFTVSSPSSFSFSGQLEAIRGPAVGGADAVATSTLILERTSGGNQRWAFDTPGAFAVGGQLLAGDWRLSGNAHTRLNADASFSGTLVLSPVPEPASWALCLAGLLPVWRRRRSRRVLHRLHALDPAAKAATRRRGTTRFAGRVRRGALAAAIATACAAAPVRAQTSLQPIGDAYYAYYFYDLVELPGGGYDEVRRDSGAQHGGTLLKNHVAGGSSWGVPGGGVVAAYNDGQTFWSQSVAPHVAGNDRAVGTTSQIYVAQSFRKDSIDASLSFTFSAGSLQLMDYGASRGDNPVLAAASFSALVVEHATGLLEFEERQEVKLHETFGATGSANDNRWDLIVRKENLPLASGDAPWSWSCDACGQGAYGFVTAELQAPYTQQLRISGIALGEEFTVSFLLETQAWDLRQGETGAAAYAQDPLAIGGSGPGFSFSGLTPTNRPIVSAVPEPQAWALMLAGAAWIAWRRRAAQPR